MTTALDVVNDCLASMGEAPINSLLEYHEFGGSAQRLLSRNNEALQSVGWWFNTETVLLSPSESGEIQLPTDCLKWQSGVRDPYTKVVGQAKPWLVERGNKLYDTRHGTYVLTEEVTGEIIRSIPFEDLPLIMREYIAASTVLQFQSDFDADNNRRAELVQRVREAKFQVVSENIRQRAVNLLAINPRLVRIKRASRGARY